MKEKVLVIFGSMSKEHEISCVSASNVIANLDKNKYDVTLAGIDKEGSWYYYTGEVKNIKENKWIEDKEKKIRITNFKEELTKYDVAFPVLHGKYGEDGALQGLLEMFKVCYVGNDVLGSSIGMDKILSKELVESINIPVVEYIALTKDYDKESTFLKIEEKLNFPVIVKPSKEGSSYGVTKVDNKDGLVDAIENALKYDSEILVEKYIARRQEIECAVLENLSKEKIYISTPGEIISANEFYDFEAKYENEQSTTKIPANISEENKEKIKEYAKIIFKKLRLTSIARIDFFLSDNNIYFNEVNTMPGFTSISMYPMMLIHDGLNYSEILDILIENAKCT